MQLIEITGRKRYYQLDVNECQVLFDENAKFKQHTYPKPNEGYVATVMTIEGGLFTGVSYGSDTQTLTMHGEMTALAHAAIHGYTNIIAISGPNCHICKQIIYESSLRSGIDIIVVTQANGSFIQTPISQLMPQPWPESV